MYLEHLLALSDLVCLLDQLGLEHPEHQSAQWGQDHPVSLSGLWDQYCLERLLDQSVQLLLGCPATQLDLLAQ